MAEQLDVASEKAYWQGISGRFQEGISERVRAMSLGSLVLIWGILTGDVKEFLTLSKIDEFVLLSVAGACVLVLMLDFLEYILGCEAALVRSGSVSAIKKNGEPRLDYATWRNNSAHMKQIVGCISPMALVIVLGMMLFSLIAHAQVGSNPSEFVGSWCGGQTETNHYAILDIEVNFGQLQATLNKISCAHPTINQDHFLAKCGEITINAHRKKNLLQLDWRTTSHEGSLYLVKDCQHSESP